MKKFFPTLWICIVSMLCISTISNATLIDNGDGTITQIRNDGSRLMWLQHVNSNGNMNWTDAMDWVDKLIFATYDDWRLPTLSPINGVSFDLNSSYDGSTDVGYNITSLNNELSYLYYVELENLGKYNTNGNLRNPGEYGFLNTSPFVNLTSAPFWTDVEYINPASVWYFHGVVGSQEHSITKEALNVHTWAVRNMEPVPEPATLILFGTGIVGILGTRLRK